MCACRLCRPTSGRLRPYARSSGRWCACTMLYIMNVSVMCLLDSMHSMHAGDRPAANACGGPGQDWRGSRRRRAILLAGACCSSKRLLRGSCADSLGAAVRRGAHAGFPCIAAGGTPGGKPLRWRALPRDTLPRELDWTSNHTAAVCSFYHIIVDQERHFTAHLCMTRNMLFYVGRICRSRQPLADPGRGAHVALSWLMHHRYAYRVQCADAALDASTGQAVMLLSS